jgi:hypothetical protein
MHGKIEVNHSNIEVAGFVNWFPIGFMCIWYSSLFPVFRVHIEFMLLFMPVICFGLIYIMQSRRYNKIVSQLAEYNERQGWGPFRPSFPE